MNRSLFARVFMNLWSGRHILLFQLVSTNCWNKIPLTNAGFSHRKHVTSKCFFQDLHGHLQVKVAWG